MTELETQSPANYRWTKAAFIFGILGAPIYFIWIPFVKKPWASNKLKTFSRVWLVMVLLMHTQVPPDKRNWLGLGTAYFDLRNSEATPPQPTQAQSPRSEARARTEQTKNEKIEEPVLSMSISKMLREWSENSVRAEDAWKGKKFRFTGTVMAVGQGTTIGDFGLRKEFPVVAVAEGYSAEYSFSFKRAERDWSSTLRRGAQITFVCVVKGKGQYSNDVVVEDCIHE